MSSDTNLRAALVQFREVNILKRSVSEDDRRECILRRGMIDWLVAEKPPSLEDWIEGAPQRLWAGTDKRQFNTYGEAIIKLVRMHSLGGRAFRR